MAETGEGHAGGYLSETPSSMGGPIDGASPCYAEDNRYVYQEILGLAEAEIAALQVEDVI